MRRPDQSKRGEVLDWLRTSDLLQSTKRDETKSVDPRTKKGPRLTPQGIHATAVSFLGGQLGKGDAPSAPGGPPPVAMEAAKQTHLGGEKRERPSHIESQWGDNGAIGVNSSAKKGL